MSVALHILLASTAVVLLAAVLCIALGVFAQYQADHADNTLERATFARAADVYTARAAQCIILVIGLLLASLFAWLVRL